MDKRFEDYSQNRKAVERDEQELPDAFASFVVARNHFPHLSGGQYVYLFPNGYGASVIRHRGSYGFEQGLFEIAALLEGEFCECTGTDRVYPLGHLTWEQVQEELKIIAETE